MRTIKQFDQEDYVFLLKGVIDSRLLFTTKESIADHIGIKTLKKQAVRKAIPVKFMQKSVFEGLSDEVAYMCDNQIDLATFIHRYEEASKFYHQRIKNLSYFKDGPDGSYNPHLFDLLDMIYVRNEIEDGLGTKEKKCIEDMYDEENDTLKVDAVLIIMLILKVLPTYNEGGDFGSSDENGTSQCDKTIEKDFETMCRFLKEYSKHQEFDFICSLDVLERVTIEAPKVKEETPDHDNIPVMNRVSLYWYTATVLNDIDIYTHSDKCGKRSEEYQQTQLFPDISGFWCKDESGNSFSYWKIKQMNYGYQVELCERKSGRIEYDTAELYLYDYTSNFYDNNAISQQKEDGKFRTQLYKGVLCLSRFAIPYFDDSAPFDTKNINNFICYVDFNEKGQPVRMEIFPVTQNGYLKRSILYPVPEESQLAQIDKKGERINTGFQYKARRSLVAITQEYLYLGRLTKEEICSDVEYLEDKKYDEFYKVPKVLNDTFWGFKMTSNINIVVASFEDGDRYYIAAPDSLDYYDITNLEETKEKYGVEIQLVNKIEQD